VASLNRAKSTVVVTQAASISARLCYLNPRLDKSGDAASGMGFSLSRSGSDLPYVCSHFIGQNWSHMIPSNCRGTEKYHLLYAGKDRKTRS